MLGILKKIQNLGTNEKNDPLLNKRIIVVNSISLMSISMCMSIITIGFFNNWPFTNIAFIFFAFLGASITLFFNALSKTSTARIYNIISSNILLLMAAILFGNEHHFQYFLLASIASPLLLIGNEFGKLKIILILLPITVWIIIEIYFVFFPALIPLETNYILRFTNDFFTFSSMLLIFYFFISENSKHLKIVQEKSDELEQVNTNLDQFSYVVAHDLKAPLRNISSLICFAREDYAHELNPEMLAICSQIEGKAIKSQQLVDSVLAYSKAGESKDDITTFNLNDLFQETYNLIEIPNSFTLKSSLPTIKITGSKIKLQQTIKNIVDNAIKYHNAPNNGVISISAQKQNDKFIKIFIKDNGPGIEQKYQHSIFNMFNSGSQTTRRDSTGIGLAIVKKLVHQSGGEIGVRSKLNKGSTFWFTWPYSELI